MPSFYRGSTPTIRLKPLGGFKVSDLGSPKVAMTQELVFYSVDEEDLVIDAASNTLTFKLPYEESLRFVPGIPVQIQQVWQDDDGNTVVFPVHDLDVLPTVIQIEDDVEVEEDEEDTLTILDDDWGL